MRELLASVVLVAAPVVAMADRYGVDDASETGPLPPWLLPVMFAALLIYHLFDHDKMDGARAFESSERERAETKLREALSRVAELERDAEKLSKKYYGLQSAVQRHFEGLSTDEAFTADVERYLGPIEYTVYKKPKA